MSKAPNQIGVDNLANSLKQSQLPPIHKWNPPYCGEIDIRIARDGSWTYQGSPITRKKLVRLFSTVLRREDDNHYYLVTPVEKVRIVVEDAPFVAVDVEVSGDSEIPKVNFTTNLGDVVLVDDQHPMWVVVDSVSGEPSPYVRVRDKLNALIARSVYYRLVDFGQQLIIDGVPHLGISSCGQFFSLGYLE